MKSFIISLLLALLSTFAHAQSPAPDVFPVPKNAPQPVHAQLKPKTAQDAYAAMLAAMQSDGVVFNPPVDGFSPTVITVQLVHDSNGNITAAYTNIIFGPNPPAPVSIKSKPKDKQSNAAKPIHDGSWWVWTHDSHGNPIADWSFWNPDRPRSAIR